MAYAMEPKKAHDLLITPDWHYPSGKVAAKLAEDLRSNEEPGHEHRPDVAYLDGLVAARLCFRQVLHNVVTMTDWWQRPKLQDRTDPGDGRGSSARPDRRRAGMGATAGR